MLSVALCSYFEKQCTSLELGDTKIIISLPNNMTVLYRFPLYNLLGLYNLWKIIGTDKWFYVWCVHHYSVQRTFILKFAYTATCYKW